MIKKNKDWIKNLKQKQNRVQPLIFKTNNNVKRFKEIYQTKIYMPITNLKKIKKLMIVTKLFTNKYKPEI